MRRLLAGVVVALLSAACGSSDDTTAPDPAAEVEVAEQPLPAFVSEGLPPPLEVGLRSVELSSGDTIDFALMVPEGFTVGASVPVMLALPPGGQGLSLAASVLDGTWAEAARRGWVVVSPASPGELYFEGGEELLSEFLNRISEVFVPESGAFDLVGISNGGISSFRILALDAELFRSVLVAPGFASTEEDLERLAAAAELGIPVSIFVGETDAQGWIDKGQDTVDAIVAAGGTASMTVVAGEGHRIDQFADGVHYLDVIEQAVTG